MDQITDRVRDLGGDPDKVEPSSSGGEGPMDQLPPKPADELDAMTGDISRILYDCFGRFEGFVLKTCAGEHAFRACEPGIEKVVFNACRENLRVTSWFRKDKVKRIAINCC